MLKYLIWSQGETKHVIASSNSIIQLSIKIKNGIMIHVNVHQSWKSIDYAEKIIVGILAHLFVIIVGI